MRSFKAETKRHHRWHRAIRRAVASVGILSVAFVAIVALANPAGAQVLKGGESPSITAIRTIAPDADLQARDDMAPGPLPGSPQEHVVPSQGLGGFVIDATTSTLCAKQTLPGNGKYCDGATEQWVIYLHEPGRIRYNLQAISTNVMDGINEQASVQLFGNDEFVDTNHVLPTDQRWSQWITVDADTYYVSINHVQLPQENLEDDNPDNDWEGGSMMVGFVAEYIPDIKEPTVSFASGVQCDQTEAVNTIDNTRSNVAIEFEILETIQTGTRSSGAIVPSGGTQQFIVSLPADGSTVLVSVNANLGDKHMFYEEASFTYQACPKPAAPTTPTTQAPPATTPTPEEPTTPTTQAPPAPPTTTEEVVDHPPCVTNCVAFTGIADTFFKVVFSVIIIGVGLALIKAEALMKYRNNQRNND